MSNKYLEIPWSMEDTVRNLNELKESLQMKLILKNLHGRGEKDAEEIAFDFNRAIDALKKQISKKPTYDGDGYAPDGTFIWDEWICPNCGSVYEVDYDDYNYCPVCGQRIDFGKDDEADENNKNDCKNL